MTRTHAFSFLAEEPRVEGLIERTQVTRSTPTSAFLGLLIVEIGALAVIAIITVALLTLI